MTETQISSSPLFSRWTRAAATAAVAAVLAIGPVAMPTPVFAASAPESFADMAQKLLPSVVNVYTTQTVKQPEQRGGIPDMQLPPGSPFEQFFKDFMNRQRNPNAPPRKQTSLGSGFIIDETGYVVTNNHVIDGADEISVRLQDDTELKATLVGKDPRTDLALLKVETSRKLPAVPWGNSTDIRIGDWVLAIGNPFGLGGTVTAGILSARNRSMGGAYDDFLQTDASINRGNSGGPMFNMKGEVIGINSAILSPNGGSVGIGFAIASNLAKPVIEQIRNGGQVKRGWLGVRIQKLDEDVATGFGLDKARGALVSSVQENSPAAKAQIKQGDVILKFDGKDVPESDRLPRIVADTPIGKAVDATVWRNRKEITVKVTVGELKEDEVAAATDPSVPAVTGEVKSLGLTLSGLNAQSREKYGLDESATGVLVTDAAQDSAAFEKGVRPGDLITEVGQESVKTPNDVSEKIKAARDAKKKSVLLTLSSRGETRFVAVRVD